MKTFLRSFVPLVFLVVILSSSGDSCGPYFSSVAFMRSHGPDGPIAAFDRGAIGIPLNSWWRPYLIVTYRYLQNRPLSNAEAQSFEELWGVEQNYGAVNRSIDEAIKHWLTIRGRYRKGGQTPAAFKDQVENYSSSLNCLAGAFNTAAETLIARAKTFGPSSPELREWLDGQDAVFANCKKSETPPQSLPPSANPLLRSDRDYQIAAADFYRGNFQEAVLKFDAIAQDNSSPWHGIAPYLSVRALVRKNGGLETLGGTGDPDTFKQIQRRLGAILQDPSRVRFHHDARMIQNLIAFKMQPDVQKHRLAARVSSGGIGEDFGQEVRDYTMLLDQGLDEQPDFPNIQRYTPEYAKKLAEFRAEQFNTSSDERDDDLTDWLITLQSEARSATQHALARWHATHSRAWLFVALTRGDLGHDSSELLKAAAQVPTTAPVYVAINFYRSRILRSHGDFAGVRSVAGEILASHPRLPISAFNLLKDEQLMASPSVDTFTSLLGRVPAYISNGFDEGPPSCYSSECEVFYGLKKADKNSTLLPQFDLVSAGILNNRVPVEVLSRIAQSGKLPPNLQKNLAIAAWSRAALVEKPAIALGLIEHAGKARPLTKTYLDQYAAAQTSDERRFAAVFAILHFPGMRPYVEGEDLRTTAFTRIDNYRDNWWCSDVGSIPDATNYMADELSPDELNRRNRSMNLPSPPFLSPQQSKAAQSELKQLQHLGHAADYLPATVLQWVKAHPDDPRDPEALHLAVRATRYGCYRVVKENSKPSKNYSREAFLLLHRKYGDSPWTKKTPYWF
jgi:hypothetical protein